MSYIVCNREGAALVGHVLLGIRKARADASDIAAHLFCSRACAVLEGAPLLLDPWPLIGEPYRHPVVQDRDRGLHEVGMDEVLDNLSYHHERDRASLFMGKARDLACDLLEIGADILGLHDDDPGRCSCIVVDRDARGIVDFECRMVSCRPRILDERVEIFCHPAPPYLVKYAFLAYYGAEIFIAWMKERERFSSMAEQLKKTFMEKENWMKVIGHCENSVEKTIVSFQHVTNER